ncbi:MAG: HD-GYP domain-containing protein [Anaerolineales bacterium]|nr:MAG: HD-GYP domain-containing protein [Anaerolineales bacterium]
MKSLSHSLRLYVGTVSLLGGGIVLLALSHLPTYDLGGYAFFVLLSMLIEAAAIRWQSPKGRVVSASSALTYAVLIIYGPLPAGLVNAVKGLVGALYPERRSWHRAIFDAALLAISGTVAGLSYLLLYGLLGQSSRILVFLAAIGAGLTDYFITATGTAIAVALYRSTSALKAWVENFDLIPTPYLLLAVLGIIIALGYGEFGLLGLALFFFPIFLARYIFKSYIDKTHRQVELLRAANAALDMANQELIETLAAIIDARDIFTYGHSIRVTDYALAVAKEMGLPEEEREMIRKAGLLHDIGKVGISERILTKKGILTQDERHILEQHPVLGEEILGRVKDMIELAEIVGSHHERYNGKGYPCGHKGQEIPLAGRILGVADALDAMLSDRPYRPAMSLLQALVEIQRNAGMQFDPYVVEALLRVAEKAEADFFKNSTRTTEAASIQQADDHPQTTFFRPKSVSVASHK